MRNMTWLMNSLPTLTESLEETLKTLLSRLNATLTSVVHDNHHENGDNQTHEEAEGDNHHDDLHRVILYMNEMYIFVWSVV